MGLIPSVDSLTAGTYINVPTIGAGIASASPIDLSGYFGNSNTSNNIFSNMGLFDSIFGGMASIFNTGSTNRTNAQIARETNEQNYKIWQEQKQHNYAMFDKENQAAIDMFNLQNQAAIDMWNMQNAYNDPSQQVERLQQAGINPYLYLSGQSGAAGNASSAPNVGSLSPGDINPSQAPTMVGYQHQAVDLTPFMQGLQMDMQKKHFEITSQIEMMKTMANIGLLGEQQKGQEVANRFALAVFDYQVEQEKQASLQSISKTAFDDLQVKIAEKQLGHMDDVHFMDMLQRGANYMFTLAQKNKTEQEALNLLQEFLYNEDTKHIRKKNLELQNDKLQSEIDLNNQLEEESFARTNNEVTKGSILTAESIETWDILNANKASGVYYEMARALASQYSAAVQFNVREENYNKWKNDFDITSWDSWKRLDYIVPAIGETIGKAFGGSVNWNMTPNKVKK